MATWTTVPFAKVKDAERIDAEYFDPEDLRFVDRALKAGFVRLDTLCTPVHGKAAEQYVDDGPLRVVRAGDLIFPLIYADCGAEFLRTYPSRNTFHLTRGDVLISSIGMGSIGKVSLVMDATNLVSVPEVTILTKPKVAPEFLFYYLRTSLGLRLLLREVTGATGQQHLLKEKVGRVLVPPIPDGLVSKLQSLCHEIWESEQQLAQLRAAGPDLLAEHIPLITKP